MGKIITVVGSCIYDFRITAERLPKPGETLKGWGFGISPGGKGANQAAAAALLGAETYMVANIGCDYQGDELIKAYDGYGIHSDYVFRDKSVPTSTCLIHVSRDGENAIIIDNMSANSKLSARHVEAAREILERTSVLLLQNEVPFEASSLAIDIVKGAGGIVIFNPAPADAFPEDWYSKTDYITPNESEAECYTGIAINGGSPGAYLQKAREAARALLKKGARNAIVTLGSSGSIYAARGGAGDSAGAGNSVGDSTGDMAGDSAGAGEGVGAGGIHFPAYKVDAVDSTAAGDAFNGALAVMLSEGADIGVAINFASAAGALCATKAGAQSSLPSRADVCKLLERDAPRNILGG